MSMFKGFQNVFRIPELRKKILITLGLVAVCRLISQIPTPGVNWIALKTVIKDFTHNGAGGALDWIEMFTGGALAQCAIGFLSIWPYITASIVIQLLSSVIPSLEKLKKEGESGRQQLAQITRYITIVLCVAQSWGIASLLSNPQALGLNVQLVTNPGLGFHLMTVIGMTTASLFVMWIADQITTFGIGNGASLIIMINITSRLPRALKDMWTRYFDANGDHGYIAEFVIVLLLGFFVIMGTVLLTQGVRRVLIHATRRSAAGGASAYGQMQQTYLPLRVNYAGVMPIIFAGPLLQVMSLLSKIQPEGSVVLQFLKDIGDSLVNQSTLYIILYAILIMFFTFFWVATQFNAVDISENLKKDGSYVPGVRPGRATAEYLDSVMTRVTLIGGTGLLIVAILPVLLTKVFTQPKPISWTMASFFGGTSLLIIVGVALDTLRIMESHLLVRKYDGFLRHGTLRGRKG